MRAFLALGAGVVAALLLTEVLLAALDLPRFHEAHTSSDRFTPLPGPPGYVNAVASKIRFRYDGDPRGYFDARGGIVHETNALGFRGGPFQPENPEGVFRMAFLGDSFTFGEGVWFEDTYPEVTADLLREASPAEVEGYESLNFGVGGYNTTQALELLRAVVLRFSPDVLVLGYVLNDAEPPLFERDPGTGELRRRPREDDVPEGVGDARPPQSLLFRSRIATWLWQLRDQERRGRETVEFYRSLYRPEGRGWEESRAAMHRIGELCRERGIRYVVVLFPILVDLDGEYPFEAIHDLVKREARAAGAELVDLLPRLRGRRARDLWVHPTDQHPNEVVHAIAAQALAERLSE